MTTAFVVTFPTDYGMCVPVHVLNALPYECGTVCKVYSMCIDCNTV